MLASALAETAICGAARPLSAVAAARWRPLSRDISRSTCGKGVWLLAGRGFKGSGDAGPQHLVATRFREYQDGNLLYCESPPNVRVINGCTVSYTHLTLP